eukprot:2387439-Rhodomonas_salina.1
MSVLFSPLSTKESSARPYRDLASTSRNVCRIADACRDERQHTRILWAHQSRCSHPEQEGPTP